MASVMVSAQAVVVEEQVSGRVDGLDQRIYSARVMVGVWRLHHGPGHVCSSVSARHVCMSGSVQSWTR